MEHRHAKIQDWLNEIYQGENVPQYEINETTSNLLNILYNNYLKAQNTSLIVQEDLEQKTKQLSLEDARISMILEQVGLNSSKLSISSQQNLRMLASTAICLNLQDTSTSSFALTLNKLKIDSCKASLEKHEQQSITYDLLRKTNAVHQNLDQLKQALQKCEEKSPDELKEINYQIEKTHFLKQKIKSYKNEVQKLMNTFSASKFDGSISHRNLAKLDEELELRIEKHSQLKFELEAYQNFPSDIHLAKLKLLEAKKENERLDKDLMKQIGDQSLRM